MSYARIIEFGAKAGDSATNNPLTYCATSDLNNSFLHTAGQKNGPYSQKCAMFMSDYCAQNWDGICEYESKNINSIYPNLLGYNIGSSCHTPGAGLGSFLTKGENLIHDTAAKKYLTEISANCGLSWEPFDPQVATSPLISSWVPVKSQKCGNAGCCDNGTCVPRYEVDPKYIDSDPVMNKILNKPEIAIDILVNIYRTMKMNGKLESLKGTKIYNFFMSHKFQNIIKK